MKLLKGVAPLGLHQTNFLMQPITPILTFPRQGGRDFSSPPRRERKRAGVGVPAVYRLRRVRRRQKLRHPCCRAARRPPNLAKRLVVHSAHEHVGGWS